MSGVGANTSARDRDWVWLAAVTCVAAALRMLHLGTWSFWADEVFTLRDARAFPDTLTMNPLPYACVAASIKLFGVSEWSARIAPAVVGIACAPLSHWAGRRLFSGWTGRAASLLVALSPWHLFWSQNSRHYVFTFAFALVALVAFHEATREGSTSWAAVALTATAAVGLSHTPAAAFVLGPCAYCATMTARRRSWAVERRRLRALLVYFGPMAVVGVVVLATPGLRGYVVSGWGRNVWARSIPYILMTYAHGVTLPVLAAAAVGMWGARPLSSGHLLTVCGLVAPVMFLVVTSLAQNIPGYYLFFTSACALLLAARACGWAITADPKRGLFALSLVCAALLGQDVMYFTSERGGRPPWKQALHRVASEARRGDVVYMSLPDIGEHYLDDASGERAPRTVALTTYLMAHPDDLGAAPDAATYVVVDMRSMARLDPDGTFMDWIAERGTRVVREPGYARGSDRTIEAYRLSTPPPR